MPTASAPADPERSFSVGDTPLDREQCSVFVITHGLSPMVGIGLADVATGRRLERISLILIAIAGAAPDVLSPHISLADRLSSWTHNIWFLIGSAPVWFLVARRFADSHWIATGALMVVATAFHLFCDAISGGIAWLYPYSHEKITRQWVPYQWWLYLDIIFVAATGLLYWLRQRAWGKKMADPPSA